MDNKLKVKLGAKLALLMRTRYSQKQAPKSTYTKKDRKSNKVKNW